MEFMVVYTPRDARRAAARFTKWAPPEGYNITAHYFSPDGRGFAIVEADSVITLVAATAAFDDVIDFEVTPVAPIEEAMPVTIEGFAWVDSLGAGA